MEKKQHSAKFLRQRKMALVMPIMVLPFLILFILAVSNVKGGTGTDSVEVKSGVNMRLPGAQVKTAEANGKLGFYQRALEDSLRLRGSLKNDPYSLAQMDSQYNNGLRQLSGNNPASFANPAYNPYPTSGGNSEAKVYTRLSELNNAINNPVSQSYPSGNYGLKNLPSLSANGEVERLENMMQVMKGGTATEDTEMNQIHGMIESILDIQHPQRVQEKLKKASEQKRGQVFPVSTVSKKQKSILDLQVKDSGSAKTKSTSKEESNDFYSDNETDKEQEAQNAIEAVVHESQEATDGSTVKLRLLHEVYINGVLIPRGTLITGLASFSGERLSLKVSAIRYKSNLFPIDLDTYDMDGIAGIRIRGVTGADVAKGTANETLAGIGMNSFDPSIGAQAANAGVELSKRLFSKKIKAVKVTLTAGYRVLLFDRKNNDQ